MKTRTKLLPALLGCALLALAPDGAAQAPKLKVLATVPTYADLAQEIGGELVEVTTICRPGQDVHGVTATPSLVERIRDADLLLYTGLDLELWLDPMLRSSGNLDLLPGNPRAIEMSAGIQLKEVPSVVDRSKGDIHALGNPHVWTDPLAVRTMAGRVRDALTEALPDGRDQITARHKAFHDRLTAALVDWLTRYNGLKGRKVIVYHRSWAYFLDRFGLVEAGALEPKPRVAPTASHLSEIVETMKRDGVKVVIREPWQATDAAEFVAEATGAKVLELASHPEAGTAGDGILLQFEKNLDAIADALGVKVAAGPGGEAHSPGG
ncbi:MAG TPA: metal ABC transporter substrate-binding protein [Planctomycetota bacterium]|nr:metal ABC transporter substrate-binding protein [Planctomycetota bacterium]